MVRLGPADPPPPLGSRFGPVLKQQAELARAPFWVKYPAMDTRKTMKTIAKQAFCNIGNPDPENLINTVVYEDFWRPFAKK